MSVPDFLTSSKKSGSHIQLQAAAVSYYGLFVTHFARDYSINLNSSVKVYSQKCKLGASVGVTLSEKN